MMRIDVSALLEENGGAMDFAVDGNLNQLVEATDNWSMPWDIHVEGNISNSNGILNMTGIITGAILLKCDRCLETYAWPLFLKIKEEFAKKAISADDDINVYEGDTLYIDDIIYSDIVLEIPMKSLCTIECKGLCPNCGAELNYGDCGCKKDEVDIRLAGLNGWLERVGGEL